MTRLYKAYTNNIHTSICIIKWLLNTFHTQTPDSFKIESMAEQKKMYLEIIADRDATITRLNKELENVDGQMKLLKDKVSVLGILTQGKTDTCLQSIWHSIKGLTLYSVYTLMCSVYIYIHVCTLYSVYIHLLRIL